jgi:hypothetical protein
MAITRKNDFHLLLSDDESRLLDLLAEREGLDPADYLRALIRAAPSTSTTSSHATAAALAARTIVGTGLDLQQLFGTHAKAIRVANSEADATEGKKSRSRS